MVSGIPIVPELTDKAIPARGPSRRIAELLRSKGRLGGHP